MTLLLFQMTAVLLTCLVCGRIAQRLGQGRVIGEMVGGILIGPSVFGRVAPHAASILFPQDSLDPFEVLSTVGLILFLFLIGSELNYEHLSEQKATATLASLMSIVLPFSIAAVAAPMLRQRFAPQGVDGLAFLLFLGISMSITAFPVLARILEERGLQSTSLGAMALMCAAVDDVCAWLLLAVAMTLLPTGGAAVLLQHRFFWLGAYLLVMFLVVRPLGFWLSRQRSSVTLSYQLLGVILVIVFVSSAVTDAIGVHPLFGAFLAGLCFRG